MIAILLIAVAITVAAAMLLGAMIALRIRPAIPGFAVALVVGLAIIAASVVEVAR